MQTLVHPHHDYNMTTEGGRVKIWNRGLGYIAAHPLLGVGVRNFQVAEGTISPLARRLEYGRGVHWNAPHNTFIQAAAEIGIPGLLLLVAVIGSALVALRRVARFGAAGSGAPEASRLAQCLTAALAGFVVGAFFLSLAYADMLYTLVALALALAKSARLAASGAGQEPAFLPATASVRVSSSRAASRSQ